VSRFHVLIAGGGIAAVEGLLRLRRLAGDALDITLVSPSLDLRLRPLAVDEPFARGRVATHPLSRIARRTGADLLEDTLEWVEPGAQTAHLGNGSSVPYDALLLAIGGRLRTPFDHVTTFDDANADETFRGIVQDVEEGYTRSIAFVLPEGPAWPLPAYELALMTAERASSMGEEGVWVGLVTPEPAPLAQLGTGISDALAELLAGARVELHTGASPEVPASRRVLVTASGPELEAERIVAMPRVEGNPVRGIPATAEGFIPVDEHCGVRGLDEHVFAAGDATDFPIKHGGLGAQQADAAASSIAALAGAASEREPLRAVVHGILHTGGAPLYLNARLEGHEVVESEASTDARLSPGGKVAAEELQQFLDES
jgi:sulfide:quinone oxidoreductase